MFSSLRGKKIEFSALLVSLVSLGFSLYAFHTSNVSENKVDLNFHSTLLSEIKSNNNKSLVFTAQNANIFPRSIDGELDCARKPISESDAKSILLAASNLSDLDRNFDISQLRLIEANEMSLINEYQNAFNNLQQLAVSSEKIKDETDRKKFRTVIFLNFCNFANISQKTFNSFDIKQPAK